MDEDIAIINTKTRNEKIKNFFVDKKKTLIIISLLIVAILISFYSFQIYKEKQKEHLSKKYNNAVISFNNGDKTKTLLLMKEVIENKDNTYSPLALYFLIDNNLIENKKEINNFFNLIINKVSLENEIRNLIIYKKALFNADAVDENQLIDILKPVINSKSVWRSHALYLIAEYFYSKNEKQKSKEFFSQILSVENANQDIIKEAQKRLNRDLSE